jgi:phage-related protein
MGQDLLQLVNNGVPIIDMLASSMGVAKEKIKDMVSQGKITLPVLTKAFKDATSEGGKFNNGMVKLSTTLGGVYSTLKDNVNIAFAELGSEMAKSINLQQLIKDLSEFAGKITEKFKALSPEAKKFITYAILIATVLAPVLLVFGSLVGVLGLAFSGLAMVASGFALLASPIGLIIIAGTALLFILDKILAKFGGISGAINKFRQDTATVLDFVGLEGAANFISPEINQTINKPQQMTAGGQLDVNIKGLPKGSSAGFTPRPNNFLPVGLNTVYAGG